MPSRRAVMLGVGGVVICTAGLAAMTLDRADDEIGALTPAELHEAVQAGEVLLIDVRRPDEWATTGIAKGAVPIDMRRDDFVAAVMGARASADQPIALICARGIRSRRMANGLIEAGLSPIIDVPEGMLGSLSGPGYLRSGLPLTRWEA